MPSGFFGFEKLLCCCLLCWLRCVYADQSGQTGYLRGRGLKETGAPKKSKKTDVFN